MEQANLPSQQDLNSLYGSWNPMAYMQGMQNQGLADQFRQQAFTANDIANQTAAQTFDKNQELNPLLIAHQGLMNTGQDLTNQDSKLKVDKTSALQPDAIAAERAKLKTLMSDEQMNQLSNEIWLHHLENVKTGDPVKIAETADLLELFTGNAGKVSDRVQTRQMNDNALLMKDIWNRRDNETSQANAQTRLATTKAPASWQSQFNKMPPATKKDIAEMALATKINPYTGESLDEQDLAGFQAARDSAVSTLDANNAARGQAQGATVKVENGKAVLTNKAVPSTAGKPVKQMTDDELINQYLKK